MATNDPVLLIDQVSPPGADAAAIDTIIGASTPPENVPIWNFDDTTIEYLDLYGTIAHAYDGGGITLLVPWSGAAATGNVEWHGAFRRIEDDAEDLDTTAFTYTTNDVQVIDVAPTVIGEVVYAILTFNDGAELDNLAVGERFILRMWRDTATAGDMVGDAGIHFPYGRET